jgi:hypothetical protein
MWQVICQFFLAVICSIRGRGTFYTTGFSSSTTADRTECANEPRGLLHTSIPHGQSSNEDLRTRRRKAPLTTGSFGEFRLTIRQNQQGLPRKPSPTANFRPSFKKGQLTLDKLFANTHLT